MQVPVQVIGLCRFSYPAEGGFQVEHANLNDRIAYLYAPARIEERFRHFEAITLPGLRAQTDPDFTFVILIGDAMPRAYLDRLRDLIADFPQARLHAAAPGSHRKVCQQAINAARDMSRPSLQFRHDDDDAVAVTFVERFRAAATDCATLTARHRMMGFDFNRGFIARPDAAGICAEPAQTPYWGVALGMAVQPGVRLSIMNFSHAKLSLAMPTITFEHEPMYVRGHNDHNDSRQKKHIRPIDLPRLDSAGEAEFRALFAIDADHVRRIFSN